MKCYSQLRAEEFKDRRAEIDVLLKDTKNFEIYALIGVFAYYAWLFVHCIPFPQGTIARLFPWIIPIFMPMIGSWRSFENIRQVLNIAIYIGRIEDGFAKNSLPIGPDKGWENYLYRKRHSSSKKPDLILENTKVLDNTKGPTVHDVLWGERSFARTIFWFLFLVLTSIPLIEVYTKQFNQSSICSESVREQPIDRESKTAASGRKIQDFARNPPFFWLGCDRNPLE